MAQDTPRITTGTRWAYGCGGAGYGVLYNAHFFVLIYYSQVLGLDAGLAGLAVGIALVVDAITDPLIGYLSDSTRSRWGRRHPWLYASILPLGASFYLLWHPPGFVAGDTLLFAWLMVCNVLLRAALTMFLVPAYAIVAELTADYDERTRLLTGFHVIYSVFLNGMSVLMYAIWLVPTEADFRWRHEPRGLPECGPVRHRRHRGIPPGVHHRATAVHTQAQAIPGRHAAQLGPVLPPGGRCVQKRIRALRCHGWCAVLRGHRHLRGAVGVHLQLFLGVHQRADFHHRHPHGAGVPVPAAGHGALGGRAREENRGHHRPAGRHGHQRGSHQPAPARLLPRERQ